MQRDSALRAYRSITKNVRCMSNAEFAWRYGYMLRPFSFRTHISEPISKYILDKFLYILQYRPYLCRCFNLWYLEGTLVINLTIWGYIFIRIVYDTF